VGSEGEDDLQQSYRLDIVCDGGHRYSGAAVNAGLTAPWQHVSGAGGNSVLGYSTLGSDSLGLYRHAVRAGAERAGCVGWMAAGASTEARSAYSSTA
jgi:hypothetical protein